MNAAIEKVRQVMQQGLQAAMKKAVELAPERMIPGGRPEPLAREDGRRRLLGRPQPRLDGPVKVRGAAPFAAERDLDGMLHAALAHAPIPLGRIATLDTSAVEAAPGVRLVLTWRNAPPMKPPPLFMTADKAGSGDGAPVLVDDVIRWNGQPYAVVLADTQEEADHAVGLIRVTWTREPAVTSLAEARARGTEPQGFQGEPLRTEVGDADAGLAAARHRVDAVYRTPRHNHNAIEPHAVTVAWTGDDLVVHDATQAVAHAAWSLAQVFGIDEARVRVTSPFVGGGFGGKTLWSHQILAAAASRVSGRPVRLVLSREAVYRMVGGRTLTEQRVALGADGDGRLTAIVHEGLVAMANQKTMPEPFILPTRSAYATPAMRLDVHAAFVDMIGNTFMRAPGEAVGTFALESAIDELADAVGLDPVEFRLRNEPEVDPVTKRPFSSRHVVKAWRDGAERFGWSGRDRRPGQRRDGDWWIGTGCAAATYPYYRMPGGAARLTLTRDGGAVVEIAAHEMGMGTATAQSMVVAERLGLPLSAIDFRYGDSRLPGVVLAGGSQQTAAIGAAVAAAHRALVEQLLGMAGRSSPLAGLSPDDVEGHDGGLQALADPARRESYAALLERAGRDRCTVDGTPPMPLELQKWSMHSWGAMFCEVGVHRVTGEPRVRRFLGSFDCGRILNPQTAASQFRGGIVMGLGLALMEETQFDERSGRIMNPSLSEYHVPVHRDVPPIDVMWTDIPDPHTPMGARGIGEIGITGTAAAVANAVWHATGRRVRDLPITLDKLL